MSQNTNALDTTTRDDNDVTPWAETHLIPFLVSQTNPVLRGMVECHLTETIEELSDYGTQPVTMSELTEAIYDEGRIRTFIIENQGMLRQGFREASAVDTLELWYANIESLVIPFIITLPSHISSTLREVLEN